MKRLITLIAIALLALTSCSVAKQSPDPVIEQDKALISQYRAAMGKMVLRSIKQQERINELERLLDICVEKIE